MVYLHFDMSDSGGSLMNVEWQFDAFHRYIIPTTVFYSTNSVALQSTAHLSV